MRNYEVPEPILNSPFEEPAEHWNIVEGEEPRRLKGRRPAMYFYRDPKAKPEKLEGTGAGIAIELKLVNRIREQLKTWREQGYPGVTRTTLELLRWWRREGRTPRLFFAQLEAAETTIFLTEARADYLQGIQIPRDEPSDEKKAQGYSGFLRYACKMATGSGKTTVMGMLCAWSILNKVNDRSDGRFSDTVLVVCPNVTIRNRLRELDPEEGEASIYRTRDLIPSHLMPRLTQGHVVVTNWHVFEPQTVQVGGVSARVVKAGTPERVRETIHIGSKTTTARGSRYLTVSDLERQVAAGLLTVLEEKKDTDGTLKKVVVESLRYVESDTSVVNRVLGREVGGKKNILVLNDEAHHAYRIKREEPEEDEEEAFGEEEEAEEFFREATVWIEGLDRVHRLHGINFCVDLSATPYFLGRVGQETNRPFPWVVSDFGLVDAIEPGLVKIPQLAVRDTTGADIPGYFNIWHWILPKLTPAERGGKRANPKPEAILKYAHHPIAMLYGLWETEREEWERQGTDPRPPVFILVCKTTHLAKVVYEWIADDRPPSGIPPAKMEGFRNRGGKAYTIRVDSKVVHETDTGEAKSDETRWMRFTLDTVGKMAWPADRQGRSIYPGDFEELAKKLGRDLDPPGCDVRCIVSVGMLTEGWDCNTVTHIIGLRPFMSQLLCEQVVGRGLRRVSYEVSPGGMFEEEVAKVFGVPFEVIPFKATTGAPPAPSPKRHHVHALPGKAQLEIRFPRVEGYTQAVRNRVAVDWARVPALHLEPGKIPSEVEVKGLNVNNVGRLSLSGPGRIDAVGLEEFRARHRMQELVFDLSRTLTRDYLAQGQCTVPAHRLFPQLARIVERYLEGKVRVHPPADRKDLFLAPYYGWLVEILLENIHPDASQGEVPEVPRYEATRGPGSTADVDFWTSREVREVVKSHLNYVVADTAKWEQSAACFIDRHPAAEAFVKNAGLGFAIPYLHNGQMHDYVPDFIVRMKSGAVNYLILETKGYDELEEVKRAAALRWVAAVNADERFNSWSYEVAKKPAEVSAILDRAQGGACDLAPTRPGSDVRETGGNSAADEVEFQALAEKWRAERPRGVDLDAMLDTPAYRAVIAMGQRAIGPILAALSRRPSHWVHALHRITGENPVPQE
ncbi:MAG: DEAD/DEAH box helicase family protein, partial [Planctomycetes bacterium]|nr:DEAD/DEAH box helicase family protein [Planctomycetota bacterium]